VGLRLFLPERETHALNAICQLAHLNLLVNYPPDGGDREPRNPVGPTGSDSARIDPVPTGA